MSNAVTAVLPCALMQVANRETAHIGSYKMYIEGELAAGHRVATAACLSLAIFLAGIAVGTFYIGQFASLTFWAAVDTSVFVRATPLGWSQSAGLGGSQRGAEAILWLDPAQTEVLKGKQCSAWSARIIPATLPTVTLDNAVHDCRRNLACCGWFVCVQRPATLLLAS